MKYAHTILFNTLLVLNFGCQNAKEVLVKILLNGLVGPIDGKEYGIMLPMADNDNDWIANVAAYVRSMNGATTFHRNDVRDIRTANKHKKGYWTLKELGQ
jgi:mono/diheme cytochrome c family protein